MKITQTIENTIYDYDPSEFMPIYEDGELANRSAFIAYKIGRANQRILYGARNVAATMITAIAENRLP